MFSFGVILALVVVCLILGIGWLIFFPVARDRVLFGKKPSRLIIFNFALIVSIIAVLWSMAHWMNVSGDDLLNENLKVEHGVPRWWAIIAQVSDPGNLPLASGIGRYIALACALFGIVFLSGFLVSSIVNFLTKRSQKWQQGMLRYNLGFSKYVIIIGVNEQTATLAKRALKRKDVKYVLIQTRQDVEKMRMRLDLDLDKKEEDRLVFYFAERTSWEDINALHPEKAVEIYILGEDPDFENEHDHDAFNIKCLENISQCLKDRSGKRKRCHVNFEYQSTFTAFKSTHIYRSLDKNVEFIPFNVHEIWAKKVLVDNYAVIPTGKKNEVTAQPYYPIDSDDGISSESNKTVHLIIMGMNQMGTALATQAALIAHYPNFHRDRNLRTTITFIDNKAVVEGEFFRGRFAHLYDLCRYRVFATDDRLSEKIKQTDNWIDPINPKNKDGQPIPGRYSHLKDGDDDPNFMDIQWEFIQANVASDEVRKYLSEASTCEDTITTIAVCFNHSQEAIATALYMPELVYKGAYQILVYQQNNFDLIKKVETGEKVWKRYSKLRPFGMIERSYTDAPFDNSCAKILYYLYFTRRIGSHRPKNGYYEYEPIKDIASLGGVKIDARFDKEITDLWNQLGIVDKLSNIDMVDSIPTKLRSVGLTIDSLNGFEEKIAKGRNLEYLSKAEHTRWLTERLLMGYRPMDDTDREWRNFPICSNLSADEQRRRRRAKKEIERKRRAHLDICSNTMLAKVDPFCPYNDMNVILYIPQILRYAEWLRVMRMLDSTTYALAQRKFFSINGDGKSGLAMRLVVNENKKKAIWIMDSPVTQCQWEYIMGNNPVKSKRFRGKNKPVVNVSRIDIEKFINVVRKKTGLLLDLPTREEWKLVASMTDTPDEIDEKEKSKVLWINKPNSVGPCEVRHLKSIQAQNKYHKIDKYPNFHVYDMLGNVWEWTKEIEKKNPYGKDPKKDNSVFYGGSWQHGLDMCVYPEDWKPAETDLQSDDIGFRLVWRFDLSNLDTDLNSISQLVELLSIHSGSMNNNEVEERFNIGKEYTKEQILSAIGKIVEVKGGFFAMQVLSQKDCCKKDYFVKVDDFYMLSTPVTQRLWNLVMGTTPFNNPSNGCIGDRYPQTEISWNDISDFLKKLKNTIGVKFRLPRSAEWEYASKEGQYSIINQELTSIFESDNPTEQKHKEAIQLVANHQYPLFSGECDDVSKEDLGIKSHSDLYEVGFYEPNHLGLYDMSGCVCEWCYDIDKDNHFDSRFEDESYKTKGFDENPSGPILTSGDRILRGGGWDSDESDCQSTYWFSTAQRDVEGNLGFRLVLDVVEYNKLQKIIAESHGN